MTALTIVDIDVNYHFGLANSPSFTVLLNREPDFSVYVETRVDARTMAYVAIDGPVTNFFVYKGPDEGFGGWEREILTTDGNVRQIIGGWSSRCECMNDLGFAETTDGAFTTKLYADGRFGCGMTCGVSTDALWGAFQRLRPDVDVSLDDRHMLTIAKPVRA